MNEQTPRVQVARVDRAADEGGWLPVGTAFFLTDRYALTALHVVREPHVENNAHALRLRLRGGEHAAREIPARVALTDPYLDWALLEAERAVETAHVDLAPLPPNGARWWAEGFPAGRTEDGLTIRGEVTQASATDRQRAALQLFCPQLTAGEVARGFSGAPVLVDGRVVGVLRSAFERLPDRVAAGTLYASSAARIARSLANLVSELNPPMIADLSSVLQRAELACPLGCAAVPSLPETSANDEVSDLFEVRVEISRFRRVRRPTKIVIRVCDGY